MDISAHVPMATDADQALALAEAPLEIVGRLIDSSNGAFVARTEIAVTPVQVVYKPASGERPLWDFPDVTLGRHEVAAFELSAALGWHQVPLTVWREDGPAGPGMCQLWIDGDLANGYVSVFPLNAVPAAWLSILEGVDAGGRPRVLAHSPGIELQRLAVFDYLANNADRKGGHLIVDTSRGERNLWAIDHGLTFHTEPKLRTVLWGFAGDELPPEIRNTVVDFVASFQHFESRVVGHLDATQISGVLTRAEALLAEPVFPLPRGDGPAVPWPIF